jgi:ABC-type sugar transport system ATPase subunit
MIDVDDLALRQGAFALAGVSLHVPQGRYAVLMGATGCGKTTVLEAIAGLRPITAGRVRLNGVDRTFSPPSERSIGYVPQDGALFTTMTVRGNLGFALSLRRRPAAEVDARVLELARWLGIEHLLDRRAVGLSGGEAQRVALGRALANHPPVLLLDEPLSALDDPTRDRMIEVLGELPRRADVTVLHVTHSRAEADRLADVVFHLDAGKIAVARGTGSASVHASP